MIALTCPGQGAQSQGFLRDWLELDLFRSNLESYSEILKMDLVYFGTEASAEEIRDTRVAQPLIVAAGLASHAVLADALPEAVIFEGVAGHSVGEITAASIAGILSIESALGFVKTRGEQMAIAASLESTSMAAVVGGDQEAVLSHLDEIGLSAANYNGPGQIVAAGSAANITALVAKPPLGTRVVGLAVAGAFHTAFMESAKEPLRFLAASLETTDPKLIIWSNNDGSRIETGARFLELLIEQVSKPLRWDKTMNQMNSDGVAAVLELLPGGTLTGIAKRAMPGVATLALKTPADLDKAADFVREHSK